MAAEFDYRRLLEQIPALANPPAEDQLEALAALVGTYRRKLRQHSVPCSLTNQLVAELHNYAIWKADNDR